MRTNLNELRRFLNLEFARRQSSNPAYSKTAFSRDIGVSTTALNDFISGRRTLSFKNIDKIFDYLNSKIHCSWCDAAQREVSNLISGPRNQYICEPCVKKCVEILGKEERAGA